MDSTLQSRIHLWRQRNFPNADADQLLLGIIEELGELAHANLKRKQNIREMYGQRVLDAEQDAIGDIAICLMGYCSYRGWDLLYIVNKVAQEVTKRDWIKYPDTGLPPTELPSLKGQQLAG